MKIYCPYCGNGEATPFSDSVFHTHGYECDSCHKDFGVDDGKTIIEHENGLQEFFFRHTEKDGSSIQVSIKKEGNQVSLYPSKITEDHRLQPYEKIDFTAQYDGFLKLIFEQLFLLDWPKVSTGFVTGKDESFEIRLTYQVGTFEEDRYLGTAAFPKLYPALKNLFACLFLEE